MQWWGYRVWILFYKSKNILSYITYFTFSYSEILLRLCFLRDKDPYICGDFPRDSELAQKLTLEKSSDKSLSTSKIRTWSEIIRKMFHLNFFLSSSYRIVKCSHYLEISEIELDERMLANCRNVKMQPNISINIWGLTPDITG